MCVHARWAGASVHDRVVFASLLLRLASINSQMLQTARAVAPDTIRNLASAAARIGKISKE